MRKTKERSTRSVKKITKNQVSRWAHLDKGEGARAQLRDYPLHGIVADRKKPYPQPYPVQTESFYFKDRKWFNLVHNGKIGTFEQWANELGLNSMMLRERVRGCNLPLEMALVSESLITSDHSVDYRFAPKYCPCIHCLGRRAREWLETLVLIESEHPEDQGRLFKAKDNSVLVKVGDDLIDLPSLARRTQIKYQTLHARIFVRKWPVDKALKTPVRNWR